MIVTENQYWWFVTLMLVISALGWLAFDIRFLLRALRETPRDKDKLFGGTMGIIMALVGLSAFFRVLVTL
jgi:hypothetical protein